MACSGRPAPEAAPVDAATLTAFLSARASSNGPTRGAALDELSTLMGPIAQRRGLEFRATPGLDAVSRRELVERAIERMQAELPERRARAEARLLSSLSLVPSGFSAPAALAGALERHLQAFYDAKARRIVIDRGLGREARRRVLAHELVHALSDQHHALGTRLVEPGTSDRQAVLLTLAEGEAEALVEELWPAAGATDSLGSTDTFGAFGAFGAEGSPPDGLHPVPDVLARALVAPHADGLALVRRLRALGGWPAIDALYRDPPGSTHALLALGSAGSSPRSPAPAAPPLPDATPPARDWVLAFGDVLGAQTWRTMLEGWLPLELARSIAGGWRGDRLSLFERDGESVLVWALESDPEQADGAAHALRRGLAASASPHSAGAAHSASGLSSCRAHRDGGVVGQWRRGPRLFIGSFISATRASSPSDACRRLARWTIPAARRDLPPPDPGPPRLTGPT